MNMRHGQRAARPRLIATVDHVASFAIGMGVGWGVLAQLGPWSATAAWLLMGTGALCKMLLVARFRQVAGEA